MFAAPFIVISCKRPVETVAPEPRRATVQPTAIDAAVGEDKVSEAPRPAPDEPSQPVATTGCGIDRTCNPPRPRRGPVLPAGVVTARLLKATAVGKTKAEVTIGIGANDGVTTAWTIDLYDRDGRIGSVFALQIKDRITIGEADVASERLNASIEVRLTPPP